MPPGEEDHQLNPNEMYRSIVHIIRCRRWKGSLGSDKAKKVPRFTITKHDVKAQGRLLFELGRQGFSCSTGDCGDVLSDTWRLFAVDTPYAVAQSDLDQLKGRFASGRTAHLEGTCSLSL